MHKQYSEKNRLAKRTVAIAKDGACIESLQLNEGRAKMFKIAKQMIKERERGYCRIEIYVRDENGTLKMKEDQEVMERWRNYFLSLLNEKNEKDKVEELIWGVTE